MTNPTTLNEGLWHIEQASAYLGVPVGTLYAWRKRRYGPPAGRVGRHLRYDPEEVRQWFRDQQEAA
ncbi:helix-turn-helix domain-containing protein [Actinoplanes sp. NPDC049668]|uniref:helix-turn-helix domain-containing protein n=1 Tax=unclassified Actinoplanes TaxID=2626549 RepID=UPI0033ACCD56